jgi:hypothetical protein
MTTSVWKALSGKPVAILKDDGQGIMVSSFQSLEFGFRVQLNDNELLLVNNY